MPPSAVTTSIAGTLLAGEAVLAAEPAEAAAERVADDADVRRGAGERREPVGGGGQRDVDPQRAGRARGRAARRVDPDAAHARGADQDLALEVAPARPAPWPVPCGAIRRPSVAGERDRGDDVGVGDGEGDGGGPLVDGEVPRRAGRSQPASEGPYTAPSSRARRASTSASGRFVISIVLETPGEESGSRRMLPAPRRPRIGGSPKGVVVLPLHQGWICRRYARGDAAGMRRLWVTAAIALTGCGSHRHPPPRPTPVAEHAHAPWSKPLPGAPARQRGWQVSASDADPRRGRGDRERHPRPVPPPPGRPEIVSDADRAFALEATFGGDGRARLTWTTHRPPQARYSAVRSR